MGFFSSIGNAISKITPWNDKTEGIIPINHITPWNDNTTGGKLANAALLFLTAAGVANAMNATKAAQLAAEGAEAGTAAGTAAGTTGGASTAVSSAEASGIPSITDVVSGGVQSSVAPEAANLNIFPIEGAGAAGAAGADSIVAIQPTIETATMPDYMDMIKMGDPIQGAGSAGGGSTSFWENLVTSMKNSFTHPVDSVKQALGFNGSPNPADKGGLFGGDWMKFAALQGVGNYLAAKGQQKAAIDLENAKRRYGGGGVAGKIAENLKSPTAQYQTAMEVATKMKTDPNYRKGFKSAASRFTDPETYKQLLDILNQPGGLHG